MPDSKEKRIKFCRYCNGLIEWGTKVCPHCDTDLDLVEFEEMNFTASSGPPQKVEGLRERPPLPKDMEERRQKALARRAAAAAKPKPPPVKPPPPPVVGPPPVLSPQDDLETQELPVITPLEVPAAATPVLTPIEDEPLEALPVEVEALAECPVCGTELGAGDCGGRCAACGAEPCAICLMRANGVRVSNQPEVDRQRWRQHVSRSRPQEIRCPACGKRGVRES